MSDLTIPAACVEAVTNMYPPLCEKCPTECGPRCKSCIAIGERIARAVLTAFLAGEAKGPWTVDYDGNDGEAGWWIVSRADGDSLYCLTLRTKGEAEAVAAALNALEPDHA